MLVRKVVIFMKLNMNKRIINKLKIIIIVNIFRLFIDI